MWARTVGAACLALILLSATGQAQSLVLSLPGPLVTTGFCQITATGAAQALSACTGGIPANSKLVAIAVESAPIRYRDDGTNPTASIGQPVLANQTLIYQGRPLSAFKFIAQSGSPVLEITFISF